VKYLESKTRFAKYLLPIILEGKTDQLYVEPFAGGMNMICEVKGSHRTVQVTMKTLAITNFENGLDDLTYLFLSTQHQVTSNISGQIGQNKKVIYL